MTCLEDIEIILNVAELMLKDDDEEELCTRLAIAFLLVAVKLLIRILIRKLGRVRWRRADKKRGDGNGTA